MLRYMPIHLDEYYSCLLVNESTRPRPLMCGEGDELKGFQIRVRVFNPGRLLVVRVRNLNDFKLS